MRPYLLDRIPMGRLIAICCLPFLFCALFNLGFFASDEYWTGITRYIPAQTSTLAHLIGPDDVKSPSQLLPFHAMAQLALNLGLERPFAQYHFMLSVLGLFSTLCLFLAFYCWPLGERQRKTGIALLGFHFGSAIAFTRPMFEALSAPSVAAAAVCAVCYDQRPKFKFLFWGAIFSTVAFLLRPQTGVIALTFVVMPVLKRDWRQLLQLCGVGVACLIVSGLIDQSLMGEFHGSLRRVLTYNVEHGSDYGSQPFYFFFPLIFILGLGFWTAKSYFSQDVINQVKQQRALLIMLGLFIGMHTLFANKFERFLIPVFPLILFLMIPAIEELLTNPPAKFRRRSLLLVNGLFWFGAVFFEPQRPLMQLVRFANAQKDLASFTSIDQAITWYPSVFQDRPVGLKEVASTMKEINLGCLETLVARQPVAEKIRAQNPHVQLLQEIQPGPIDWLAFHLNPSHNERRAPLEVLGCQDGLHGGIIQVRL